MEPMRRVAFQVVQRACMFGALAIFCLMVGFSYELRMSFQAGGLLALLMAVILVYKAHEARTKPYRKTELWLYLPKEHRPPASYAQWVTATVMRETYVIFARWTAGVSILMWVLALLFSLMGR
jgi:hypothetical protein